MARLAVAAVALAALALPAAAQTCDQEYECEYRTTDYWGAFYDLEGLCSLSKPYIYSTNDSQNTTYYFNICGTVNENCIPRYPVEFKRGVAVQFFGPQPDPSAMCTDRDTGLLVNCTRDCEVLGTGTPTLTLANPSDSFGGVNLTYYGVPSITGDPFACPYDPLTGGTKERTITFSVQCDKSAVINPKVVSAREYATCQYELIIHSYKGCGCEPYCIGLNCGSDGCGGFCGGAGNGGDCPLDQTCNNGVCCKADCNGRQCGDDGCGGSCGTCNADQACTRYQQCAPANLAPSPSPYTFPTNYVTTTTSGDYMAAFAGGLVTVGAAGLGFTFFARLRQHFGPGLRG